MAEGDPSKVKRIDGPTEMTDQGFETPASFALGAEEDIVASLRAGRLSEAAIAAFKSGRAIMQSRMVMRDGRYLVLGEYWNGKRGNEGY